MKKTIILAIISVILLGAFIFWAVWRLSNPSHPKDLQGLQKVNVALSWIHEAQFAGLYVADQAGYFEQEGLQVIFYPFNGEDLAQELNKGKYDFAILQTDTLLKAREQNLPVKAIFADYRIIPTVYFSKKEKNITKPKNLIGKTVAVAYSEKYPLLAMLNNAGIADSQVNIIERDYTYNKLASGAYDVEAGWVTDGDTVKAVAGEYNIISPYDYGVNWYADIISTHEATIKNKPELVNKFIKAVVKGWQEAIINPDEAALLTLNYETADQAENLTPDHLKFVLRESIPLIHTGDQYLGWMDAKVWENIKQLLLTENFIAKDINIKDIYTNDFITNENIP